MKFHTLTLALVAWILAPSVTSAADPCSFVINPGENCAFGAADAYSPPEAGSGLPAAFSASIANSTALASTQTAYFPFSRSTINAYQDNLFQVEGALFDSVVEARFTGNVDAEGFFALVGMAQATAKVEVQVLDLGTAAVPLAEPKVIHSEEAFQDRIVTELNPGVGGSIDLEFGSGTIIQGGPSVGIGANIPFCAQTLKENVDFAFVTLLQRGHTYALRVVSTLESRLGMLGGLSQVTMAGPAAFIGESDFPSLLATENWLDPLLDAAIGSGTTAEDIEIPDVGLSDLGFGDTLFEIGPESISLPLFGSFTIIPYAAVPNILNELPSSHDVLDAAQLPKNLKEAIDDLLPLMELLKLAPQFNAGVHVSDLEIDLAGDTREVELVGDIERILARRSGDIADYQLPSQFGGQLELVKTTVEAAIARLTTAGIPVSGRAATEVDRGDQYYAQAEWKLAFRAYRNAYRLATRL